MSRTYSNFLLFEDVLDTLSDTQGIMGQSVRMLLSPSVRVVEQDCGTYLGEVIDTSFEAEGLLYATTGDILTHSSIRNILSTGTYKIGVRNLSTCLSHAAGGICSTCYKGSFIGSTAPDVGARLTLPSLLIYQTDILIGDGYSTSFPLTQTTDDWYDVKVLNNGTLLDSSSYTINYDTLTVPVALPLNGVYVVHYYKQNTDPFQGYIAKTYSGALLGMQPLPTLKPLLRESLYEAMFSDNFVALIIEEVQKLKAIPSTYMDYLDKVHGKMEKVLLALYLYALYSSVEI